MFIEERHQEILKLLNEEGRVKARELQDLFKIGFDTVRRDLRILEEKGLLKRTHGGAIPIKKIGSPQKSSESIKDNEFAIAQEAVKLIQPNDVIFLGGATVGHIIAEHLPTDMEITIVTNILSIAEITKKYNHIKTCLIGGFIDSKGYANHHFALDMIEKMKFDISFITEGSLSSDFGLSIKETEHIPVINAILNNTRYNIGIFSHDYMNVTSLLQVCLVENFHKIITDWDTRQETLDLLKEKNITVIVADQHEVVYKTLRAKGYKGWGGSKYQERMKGWDKDLKELLSITQLKSGKILELGCGAGDVSIKLAKKGFDVTGVDISNTAISWAKEKTHDAALDIKYIAEGVTCDTLLTDQSYDLVLDSTCLHCLFDDDRIALYNNVKRWMKPKGYFFVSSVILLNNEAEIPQVSSIERCVLSEEQLKDELSIHGFKEVKTWTAYHSKHGHLWGVFTL